MRRRTCFLVSILLGVIALGLHSVARAQIIDAMHLKAGRIETAVRQQISFVPDPEAVRLAGNGRTLNVVGLVFTFSSLALLLVALVRREPGWYSVPIMVLFFDILVQVLL